MSGFKRTLVSISSQEYQRLHEAEVRLRNVERETPRVIEQARQESIATVIDNLNRVAERQAGFDQALAHFDRSIRRYESQVNQSFLESEYRISDALQENAGQIVENVQAVLDANDARYRALIDQERSARQTQSEAFERELARLDRQADDFQAHFERMQTMAVTWTQAAQSICDFINANYAADYFTPGVIGSYYQSVDIANQNIAAGAFEAGLAQAQQAYLQFSNLRLQLEQLESEYRLWQTIAREATTRLLATIDENAAIQAMDMQGNLLDVSVDADLWTGGKLRALRQNTLSLLERVDAGYPLTSIDDLYQIADESIPALSARLEKLVLEARMAVLGSQMRINIADLVVQSLEEQGFALQQADYANGDQRAEYSARVKRLDGSEVRVRVRPLSKSPGRNELTIESKDAGQRSLHELRQRAREIATSLQRRGLSVGAGSPSDPQSLPATTISGLFEEVAPAPGQVRSQQNTHLESSR